MSAGVRLVTIRGIEVRLHWSMAIVFALLVVSLATAYFPDTAPDLSTAASWAVAILASLLFFGSILLHELGHSFVALRHGIPVKSITLFIFGGIAQISGQARTPDAELRIAAAGPAVSIALGIMFGEIWFIGRGVDAIAAAAQWLATLNIVLAAFNLLPGFPLDGGRILRALVWKFTGSEQRAGQVALVSGQMLAFALMGLGALLVLSGDFANGAWLIFIGWFLQNAAVSEAAGSTVEQLLRGVTVRQAMGPPETRVPGRMMVRELVDRFVLAAGERCFLVVDDDTPRGILTLKDLAAVERDRWDWTPVRDVMKPWASLHVVTPDAGLMDALQTMDDAEVAQLPVVVEGRPIGLITREEILHYVRLRMELRESE
jgi:Zn-dependent protease